MITRTEHAVGEDIVATVTPVDVELFDGYEILTLNKVETARELARILNEWADGKEGNQTK